MITILLIIIGQIFSDIAWLEFFFWRLFEFKSNFFRILVRVAWILHIIEYHALSCMVENLIPERRVLSLRQIMFFICTISLVLILIFFIIFYPYRYHIIETDYFHPFLELYSIVFLALPSFIFTCRRLQKNNTPLICVKQIQIFLQLFCALIMSDIFQTLIEIFMCDWYHSNLYLLYSSLITIILISSAYRLRNLRLFNMPAVSVSPMPLHLKDILDGLYARMADISQEGEIPFLVERALVNGLHISETRVQYYIPALSIISASLPKTSIDLMYCLLDEHKKLFDDYFKHGRPLLAQELEFTYLYSKSESDRIGSNFLSQLNVDIFLPLANAQEFLGFVVVSRNARLSSLYTASEQEFLTSFSRQLVRAIEKIVDARRFAAFKQVRVLHEELFEQHQRTFKVQEGLRSLIQGRGMSDIGLLMFKNNQFTFLNSEAELFIPFNLNAQKGHPLTRVLIEIVRKSVAYQQALYQRVSTTEDKRIAVSAHLIEGTIVLITMRWATISDLVAPSLVLTERTEIDYLFCLETTEAGRMINRALPSAQEPFLSCKIALLKAALSKKATFIEGTEEDTFEIVHLLHALSLREHLHTIDCSKEKDENTLRALLFGAIDPFQKQHADPLLHALDKNGTLLFVQIDQLSFDLQESIGKFIATGQWSIGTHRNVETADIRILATGSRPLQILHDQKLVHPQLWEVLEKTTVSFPNISDLSHESSACLIQNIALQLIEQKEFATLLEFSDAHINSVRSKVPTTMKELRIQVQHILQKRANELTISGAVSHNTHVADKLFLDVARHGRHTLKQKELMIELWHRVQNQSKIAELLSVDRSSVSRSLKKFGVLTQEIKNGA